MQSFLAFNASCTTIVSTSFPGFSPTRPTERERERERGRSVGLVGENPGNEVAIVYGVYLKE